MHAKTRNEILILKANKRFWTQPSSIQEVLLPSGETAEEDEEPVDENNQVF